jgi:hypothetical protein
MGPKPFFPPSRIGRAIGARRAAGLFAAGALALALSSCISDGPNQTGGKYLSENGILLQDPLLHVTLTSFPVDSFWTTDGEANHLGDSVMLAGRSGAFTAVSRLAFQIAATSYLDSLRQDDSTTLKLSLGFPGTTIFSVGVDELIASVKGDSGHPGPDSIRFVVHSWDTTDAGKTDDQWGQLFNSLNDKFLVRGDTLAALGAPSAIDTITLAVRTAYSIGPQARPLPNLQKRLRAAVDNKHLIQMRLSPIIDSATGSAMLRLGGSLPSDAGLPFEPQLLFGKIDSSRGAPAANRLQTVVTRQNRRGVNYSIQYSGAATDIVIPKRTGFHVTLDREALFDSIEAVLVQQKKQVPTRTGSGDFDLTYFVPFAKMTLPFQATQLEGGFPVQMQLISSADTLLADETDGLIDEDTIPLDQSKVLWLTFELGNPGQIQDSVRLAYRPANPNAPDSALRRVELTFSKDSAARNDTTFIAVGGTRQMVSSLSGFGSGNALSLQLEAKEGFLVVRSYLNTHPAVEPNEYRDPATGETITDMERRLAHFLHPDSTSLTLRATNGIQRILNRKKAGASFLQNFMFQPAVRAAVDSIANVDNENVPSQVPYPVLSVLQPKIEAGVLKVDMDIYLFPLKAR